MSSIFFFSDTFEMGTFDFAFIMRIIGITLISQVPIWGVQKIMSWYNPTPIEKMRRIKAYQTTS